MKVSCKRDELRNLLLAIARLEVHEARGMEVFITVQASARRLSLSAKTVRDGGPPQQRGYGFLESDVDVEEEGTAVVAARPFLDTLEGVAAGRVVIEYRGGRRGVSVTEHDTRPPEGTVTEESDVRADSGMAGATPAAELEETLRDSSSGEARAGAPRVSRRRRASRLSRRAVGITLALLVAVGATVPVAIATLTESDSPRPASAGSAVRTNTDGTPVRRLARGSWYWSPQLASRLVTRRYSGPDQTIESSCTGIGESIPTSDDGERHLFKRFACTLADGNRIAGRGPVVVIGRARFSNACDAPCAPTRDQQQTLYKLVPSVNEAVRRAIQHTNRTGFARNSDLQALRRFEREFERWRDRYSTSADLEQLARAGVTYTRLVRRALMSSGNAAKAKVANAALERFNDLAVATNYFTR
jgi:hypothetical protein